MSDEYGNDDSGDEYDSSNSYLANWGRDPNVDYRYSTDPFADISGYNIDAFGGVPKPTIASETPGSYSYISGINSEAFSPQYGTSKGADYTYDNTGVVRGVGSGIAGGKAAPSKNIVKRATEALKDKESTGRSILDAVLAMYAIKSAADQQKYAKSSRGFQGSPNMALKAVQPVNIPAPRAYGAGAVGQPYKATTFAAEGGLMGLAAGGLRNGSFVIPADVVSHFGNGSSEAGMEFLAKKLGATPIKGKGDGMSDSIDTTIDGKQPAKVAHEEAIVSPEKVAALGGGDPKKGAKVLYAMMDRVRKARTGTKKQGKQIKPEKFMPGGIASLAGGGAVAFADGGTPTAGTSVTSNLSEWAGPYVTGMLGEANALGNQPYQAYTGPLTAGTSPLQQQAFTGYQNLQAPGAIGQAAQTAGGIAGQMQGLKYSPVGSDFTAQAAQQYMNPYIQAALNPQMEELRRQNDISQMGLQSKFTQAGAYGGTRSGLAATEGLRNLGQLQSQALGTGYATAYDKAMQQFNADQARKVGESQFGTRFGLEGLQGALQAAQTQGNLGAQQGEFGLRNLQAQLGAGQQQSAIEQQALDAQRAQFEEARAYPYKQLQFKQSMLSGLPISTQNAVTQTTGMQDLSALIEAIRGIGSAG